MSGTNEYVEKKIREKIMPAQTRQKKWKKQPAKIGQFERSPSFWRKEA